MIRDIDTPTSEELDEMTPRETVEEFREKTPLDGPALQELEESTANQRYLEAASDGREKTDGPIPGGPLSDAQTLHEVPLDEVGPDHKEEAVEAFNFRARKIAQFEPERGDDLMPETDPNVSADYVSMTRWAWDPIEGDDFP